jgi:hypothetical protein
MGCAVYNMLGIDQTEPLFNAAFPKAFFHLRGNVYKRPPGGHFKPEFLMIVFHFWYLSTIFDELLIL